jgi:parallel beta-helix repeat protein
VRSLLHRTVTLGPAIAAVTAALALFSVWTPPLDAHDQLFVDADDGACEDAGPDAGTPAQPFCSLQAAIDHLESHQATGGIITLRAAQYDEGTVQVPHGDLTIQGDPAAPRPSIVLRPQMNGRGGIHIGDPSGVCDDIVLRHLTIDGSPTAWTTDEGVVVDDTCDRVTLEDLEIKNWDRQGVLFADAPGSAETESTDESAIAQASIHNNGMTGVQLPDGANNRIENSSVSANGIAGISAAAQRNFTVIGTTVTENSLDGIADLNSQSTTLDGLTVTGNGRHGIRAAGDHTGLRIEDSEVALNGGDGIVLEENVDQECGTDAALTNNVIQGNAANGVRAECQTGLRIAASSAPGDGIHDNALAGIRLQDNAGTQVIDSNVYRNDGDGLSALRENGLQIANAAFSDNGDDGLDLELTVAAAVRDSEAHDNSSDGLEASGNEGLAVMGGQFLNNAANGVSFMDEDAPALQDNDIAGNELAGIDANGRANPNSGLTISGNRINNSGTDGIRLESNSGTLLEKNELSGNGDAAGDHGIELLDEADATIRKNTISRSFAAHILVDSSDDITIQGNDFDQTLQGIVFVASRSTPMRVLIGGSREERNRFRGLDPATNRCDSQDDDCYVKVLAGLLPSARYEARHNDWGTTDAGLIQNLVCHSGEGDCSAAQIDVSDPEPPGPSPSVKTDPTPTHLPPPPTPDGSCAPPLGDTNRDGRVNSIDAAVVLQHTAGLLGLPPCGDVNRDGRTDSIDAALILQCSAGLIACPT